MTPNRITHFRNLTYQVQKDTWKRQTGTRSDRQAADESDRDMLYELCGALEETLTELERRVDP